MVKLMYANEVETPLWTPIAGPTLLSLRVECTNVTLLSSLKFLFTILWSLQPRIQQSIHRINSGKHSLTHTLSRNQFIILRMFLELVFDSELKENQTRPTR